MVIHTEDLRQVAPLWLSITEQIRSDTFPQSSVSVSGMAAGRGDRYDRNEDADCLAPVYFRSGMIKANGLKAGETSSLRSAGRPRCLATYLGQPSSTSYTLSMTRGRSVSE